MSTFQNIINNKDSNYPELESLSLRTDFKSMPRYKKHDLKADPKSGVNWERAVWRLFYNMGAEAFNNNNLLTFDFKQFLNSKDPPNCKSAQIDNLCIMRDRYVFIIECKETTTNKNGINAANLIKKELSNWKDLQKYKRKRFENIFGKNLRIIHVIATKGYNWNKTDIEKLTKNNFILLREEEIQYFSGCYEKSKSSWFTFNQFLSTFRKGCNDFGTGKQHKTIGFRTETKLNSINNVLKIEEEEEDNISELPQETSASGEQETGQDKKEANIDKEYAYTTSFKVIDLLKISSVSHYKANQIYQLGKVLKEAYQRILKGTRLNRKTGIPSHIESSDSPFINNLLINYKGEKPLKDCWEEITKGQKRGGILTFDELSPGMFHIIDGQHRLFGYCPLVEDNPLTKYGEHELIVTIFDNLNPRQEAQVFIDVNKEQVKVDSNLTLEIQRRIGVEGKPEEQIISLSQSVILGLSDPQNKISPFISPAAIADSDKISTDKFGQKKQGGKITNVGLHTYISDSPLLHVSNKDFKTGVAFKADKSSSDDSDSFNKTVDNLIKIYSNYFKRIRTANENLWIKYDKSGRKLPNNDMMSTNIPIGGLLLLLDKFVEYEIGTKQKTNVLNRIDKHIKTLEKIFSKLSTQDEINLFNSSRYGGSGPKGFYYYVLENYYTKLIDNKTKDKIKKDKEKYSKKKTIKIIPQEILDETQKLIDERKLKKSASERAQDTEEIFSKWLPVFYEKVFGQNYWDDYIRPEHQQQYKKADDKDIQRQKKKRKRYSVMLYYLNWVDWQSIVDTTWQKSKAHDNYIDNYFKNSAYFKNEHNSDLRSLIEDIFFIQLDKGKNGKKENLSWFDIADYTRDEKSHPRDEDWLDQADIDNWNRLEPKIDDVITKIRKLTSI